MRLVTLSSFFKNFRFEIIYSFFLIISIKLITKQRRNSVANCRYKHFGSIMRSCRACVLFDVFCRINRKYLKYKKCYRKNRKYNLTFNYQKINKVIQNAKKLNNKITKLRLRIAHKTKQKKH